MSSADPGPPGFRISGDPGYRRMVGPGHTPVFSEHEDCGWIVLNPAGTWSEWQQVARQILATEHPGDACVPKGPPRAGQ